MKKLLIIPFLILSLASFCQIDTLLNYNGKWVFTKNLKVPSTYLIAPNDSTLIFDSSKVVTNLLRKTDSIQVNKGGVYAYSIRINGSADSIKHLFVDTSLRRDGYLLTFDSTNHRWYLSAPGAGSGGSSQWTGTTSLYFNNTPGYVGIGTTAPAARLHLESTIAGLTADSSGGVYIRNPTLATGGAQSQEIITETSEVQGWRTASGGSSGASKWRWRNRSASGTTNPQANYTLQYNTNGTWADMISFSNSGGFGSITAGTSISMAATSFSGNGFVGSVSSQLYRLSTGVQGDYYTQLDMNVTNKALGLPSNTTIQRNAWVAYERMSTYNSTTKLAEIHNGVSWNSVAQWGYTAVSATYTALLTDFTIDCTGNGTFTVTLPTAVGAGSKHYVITNSGTGTITVATTSSQTFTNVSGAPTTLTITGQGETEVQSTNTNWLKLN